MTRDLQDLCSIAEQQDTMIGELRNENLDLQSQILSLTGDVDFLTTEGMFRALRVIQNSFSVDICTPNAINQFVHSVSYLFCLDVKVNLSAEKNHEKLFFLGPFHKSTIFF